MAGYSGTPLVKKLGIKAGNRLAILEEPASFRAALGELPEETSVATTLPSRGKLDLIVLFVTSRRDLERGVGRAQARLEPAGRLWVAWPKKASGVETDVREDSVREVALAAGLVDNKVCAIDDVWSGLQLVFRLVDRPGAKRGDAMHPARRGEPAPRLPAEVNAALGAAGVKAAWDALAPSHQREWLRAIDDARRPETRARRIASLVGKLGGRESKDSLKRQDAKTPR